MPTEMTMRDHFAAAALAGLLAAEDDGAYSEESYVRAAYRWADAMLRERERLQNDAPAYTSGISAASESKLTDAEREALEQAATVADVACEEAKRWVGVPRWANGGVDHSSWQHVADSNAARAATLRGLWKRLK